MLYVVGRKDAPTDPRRWIWNGVSLRWVPSQEEFDRLYVGEYRLFKLSPDRYNTLADPYWMTDAEIRSYPGGVV